MIRLFALALPFLALGACAERIAESRIRTALISNGVTESGATCMAQRLVNRLTVKQLRSLEALSGVDRASIRTMSVGQFIARVQRIGDPEVISVVSTSGLVCALRG